METIDMLMSMSGCGGAVIAHDALAVVNSQGEGQVQNEVVKGQDGSNDVVDNANTEALASIPGANVNVNANDAPQPVCFPCTMCSEGFDKKLLLNNHMKYTHGVNFVFTERGRKVKLVRLPEDQLQARQAGAVKDVDEEQHIFEVVEDDVDEGEGENVENELMDDDGEGLGCGYAVQINTAAYQKAIIRNEIPFVAFFPLTSKNTYLLKVKEYGPVKQLLEPATKNDVINAFLKHSKNGSVKTAGDRLPIVAFVYQLFNPESGGTDISITAPVDVELVLKIASQDKFTTMAFANPTPDPVAIEGPTTSGCNRDRDLDLDDEEPIPLKIKPKEPKAPKAGRTRGKGRRSRSKSKPKEKSASPPIQKSATPKTSPPGQSVPMISASPPLPTTSTSTAVTSPPTKKPKVTRRPRATRAPKKIKSEPVELEPWVELKNLRVDNEVEIGMQEEVIAPSEKCHDEIEEGVEVDEDKKFVRTAICAPKKPPPAGPRRRGRPRKLRFDECLDDDAKVNEEEDA